MGQWNWWSVYWLIWLVCGFGIPEGTALGTGHSENTLSAQVWRMEGTGTTFARYWVATFLIWLSIHMVFKTLK
jgi:hypothetical protein